MTKYNFKRSITYQIKLQMTPNRITATCKSHKTCHVTNQWHDLKNHLWFDRSRPPPITIPR